MDKYDMTSWQEQILIGTVLGGSSLTKPDGGKNYYLCMRNKNERWIAYKAAEMSNYFPDPNIFNYNGTYRCNSPCLKSLTDYRYKLYEDDKRNISMEILDSLRDIAWMVWFVDNGGRTGRDNKNAYLNVTLFGEEGAKTASQYFNEIGVSCSIGKSKDRRRILFTVDGTHQFFKVISHLIPTFLI